MLGTNTRPDAARYLSSGTRKENLWAIPNGGDKA